MKKPKLPKIKKCPAGHGGKVVVYGGPGEDCFCTCNTPIPGKFDAGFQATCDWSGPIEETKRLAIEAWNRRK